MRFLNRKWADGGYDSQTAEMYWHVYLRHLESILDDMPAGARILADMTLGRGLVGTEVAATKLQKDSFHLVLRVKTPRGKKFLDIKYSGVDPESVDPHALDKVDHLLTDELDLAPDERLEHRLLLSPDGEFVIRFRDVDLKLKSPKSPRKRKKA